MILGKDLLNLTLSFANFIPMQRLINKHIVLGISGGIAAYKSAELVRLLVKAGAQVRVVMTQAAQKFITSLTLQALSGHPVHTDLFDASQEAAMGHIDLARWADAVLIAPASANVIARLAHGLADDLLTAACLATQAKLAAAPAMNQQMWQNPATKANIEQLRSRGITLFDPAVGAQACGDFGPGRMLEPAEILPLFANLFGKPYLCGTRILLTAGPTREALDPIRYISNHSSGKMGYALAQAAVEAGAQVTLISGPVALTPPAAVNSIMVETAQEMSATVFQKISDCDIFIACAAVADYRHAAPAQHKMSKEAEQITLKLVRNPDILGTVAALPKAPFTVGFAAQTEDLLRHAQRKLQAKGVNMLAANLVGGKETGFDSDHNALTVIWPGGQQEIPLASKTHIANSLVRLIAEHYHAQHPA